MPNRLYLAPFGSQGATRLLLEEAIRQTRSSKDLVHRSPNEERRTRDDERYSADYSSITYLAPAPRKVRAAQIAFMELVGTAAVIPPVFATLNQFARTSYGGVGPLRVLDNQVKALLISRFLPEFGLAHSRLGYARAVADFVKLVREYRPDLTPDALESQIVALLADFAKPRSGVVRAIQIVRRYHRVLAEKGWTDDQDALAYLADCPSPLLTGAQSADSQSDRILIVDGFYDLTKLEENLLARLMREASSVLALAYTVPTGVESPRSIAGFIDFLRWALRRPDAESRPPPEVIQLKVARSARTAPRCYRFSSREAEVAGIASDIKERLRAGTLESNKTLVVFPKFPAYAATVKRVFGNFGLPFTIYPERILGSSPLIVAALELLTAIENDYLRVPFVAALTSPHFARMPDASRRAANRFSIRAALVKGRDAWQHLERRLRDDEGDMDEADERLLAETQQAINLVLEFCAEYNPQQPDTLSAFARRLRALLAKLEFGANLDPADAEDAQLLADRRLFLRMLDSLVTFEADFGAEEYTLGEFHRIVVSMVRAISAPPEAEPRGVLVCNTLEARGLDCRRLYYGGLIEEELPSQFQHDPILPDWVREKLNLPNLKEHNRWQEFHFARLVNTPQDEPFLSYPDAEDDRLLLPSPFLERDPEDPPESSAIFTAEDLQRGQGAEQGVGYDERFNPLALRQEPDVRAALAQRFGPAQAQSVTALQKYCRCPVMFYLEVVLGLEIREEPGFEIKPADWGIILHRVLELLYAKGAVPLEEVPDKLPGIVRRVLAEHGLPRFWYRAVERVLSDVQADFLRCEESLRDEGYEPMRVERRIQADVFPDLRLKGRIDRIDEGAGDLRVLDYKSGSSDDISGPAILQRGTHIQLPLYARMVSETQSGRIVSNVGVYNLREMKVKWLAGKKNDLADLVEAALASARRAIDGIRRADFPPQPGDPKACDKCPYDYICARQPAVQSSRSDQSGPSS